MYSPRVLLFITVKLTEFNVFLILVYRPPSNSVETNLNLINFLLDFCTGREVILLGDFNLPSVNWGTFPVVGGNVTLRDLLFVNCFNFLGLNQWISEPTFLRSSNILDLIFTSEDDRIGFVDYLPPFPHCQHIPILCNYVFEDNHTDNTPQYQPKRQWKSGKFNKISDYLSQVDWDYEFNYLDPKQMFKKFQAILLDLINAYIPVKPIKPSKAKAYFNPPKTLLKMKQQRWAQFKHLRKRSGRNSAEALNAFHNFTPAQVEYRNYSLNSQIEYEESMSDQLSDNPKLLHSYIISKKVCPPSVCPLKLQDT